MTTRLVALAALAALAAAGTAAAGETVTRSVTTFERSTRPADPDVEVRRDDATLQERVSNALTLAFGADAEDIRVDVQDGTVFLSGYIPSESHRREAHDVVYGVAGVEGLRIDELRAHTYFD